MKFIITLYLIFCFVFISCTNYYTVKSGVIPSTNITKINYTGERKIGTITLRNGDIIQAEKIHIKLDTLRYRDTLTLADTSLGMSEISKISFKNRVVGFSHGFFIGAGVTLLIFAGQYGDSTEPVSSYAVVGLLAAGGILGGITGAIIGSNLEYTFEDNSK